MRIIPRKIVITPERIVFTAVELELIREYLTDIPARKYGPLTPLLSEDQWDIALQHAKALAQSYDVPDGSGVFNRDGEDVKFQVYSFKWYGMHGSTGVPLSTLKWHLRSRGFFRGKLYQPNNTQKGDL